MAHQVRKIAEAAHGAGSRHSAIGGGALATAVKTTVMGSNHGIYLEPPTTVGEADCLDDDGLDDAIDAITLKTNGTSASQSAVDIKRRPDRGSYTRLTEEELEEAPRMRSAGYPTSSLGIVPPASRALNSPKSVRATIKTGKGTAMSGSNTRVHNQRKTGSIRDFSAGAKDMNHDILDEPVYDLSDILDNNDSNIKKNCY